MRRVYSGGNHFDAFYHALTHSAPSKAALKRQDISIIRPEYYLEATIRRHLQQRQQPNSSDLGASSRDYPLYLDKLRGLQQPDGKWKFTGAFRKVFQHLKVPDPPTGISKWRWATAIALTVYRRHPECYDTLMSSYDEGIVHIDQDTLELAKKALIDLDFSSIVDRVDTPVPPTPLKHTLVSQEKSQDDEDEEDTPKVATMDSKTIKFLTSEYEKLPLNQKRGIQTGLEVEFIDATTIDATKYIADEIVESCWRKSKKYGVALATDKWGRARVLRVKLSGKVDIVYLDGNQEIEFNVHKSYIRKLFTSAVSLQSESIKKLAEIWQNPIPIHQEADRLHLNADLKYARVPNKRSWSNETRVFSETKPKSKHKQQKPQHSSSKQRNENSHHEIDLRSNLGRPDDVENAYQHVLSLIVEFEEEKFQIVRVCAECTENYETCHLHADQMRAFTPLTKLLWKVVEKIVLVIEAIGRWRSCLNGGADNRVAFVWNGKNVLLSERSLVEWYGDGFTFEKNPFLQAVPLSERPSTPRSAERIVYIEAKSFVETSPLLLKQRQKDLALVEKARQKTQGGALWWPERLYSADLKSRIRKAEKQLILEAIFYQSKHR